MRIARSLAEAYEFRATAVSLLLSSSSDLRCINLMCEHASKGCACRLSLTLERMVQLEDLDVSKNSLPVLPDSLFSILPRIRNVNASLNSLQALPSSLGHCKTLEVLDLRDNNLETLPLSALEGLPRLKSLLVGGNPLSSETQEMLRLSKIWSACTD